MIDGRIRTLSAADSPGIIRLLQLAEWIVDWPRLQLYLDTGTWYGWVDGGSLLGMITLFPRGEGRWSIGNVIVHPNARRQGIARTLLEFAMNSVSAPATFELIATEFGYPLYRQIGFVDCDSVVRLSRDPADKPGLLGRIRNRRVSSAAFGAALSQPLPASHWAHLASLEQTLCGVYRQQILRAVQRWPNAWLVGDSDSVTNASGFCLCLPADGRVRLGPIVAQDEDTAVELVQHALELTGSNTAFIDVPTADRDANAWLKRLAGMGFRAIRTSPAMVLHRVRLQESPANPPGGTPADSRPADRRFGLFDPAML